MAADFDPYKILQVDPSAEPEVIDAVYKRLARMYHPDVSADPAAQMRMREINAAYALLRDPEQRRAYDARRAYRTPAATAVYDEAPLPPEFDESPPRRAPWGVADMLKAIGIVVLGTLLFSVPAAVAAALVAGDLSDAEKDPTALSILLGASFFLELLLFGTAYRYSVRKYHVSWRSLGWRLPERGGWLLPIGLLVGGLIVTYVYFVALSFAGIEPDTDLPDAAYKSAAPVIILGVLSLGFAPVMEETFFRGFIFGGLRGRWGVVLAALASGALFGLAHVGNPGALYLIPPIGLVGALFALGYNYSRSLLPSMIAHFLFNLFSLIVGLATS